MKYIQQLWNLNKKGAWNMEVVRVILIQLVNGLVIIAIQKMVYVKEIRHVVKVLIQVIHCVLCVKEDG